MFRNKFLPSARKVSTSIHTDSDIPHPHLMAVAAIWGEFMYHDVSHTPQMAGFLGQRLKCCDVNFESFHPECYPIKVGYLRLVMSRISRLGLWSDTVYPTKS